MSDFQVIPAIELRGGMALRYEQVGMGTRANRVEPVGLARRYVQEGARMLHLFNLDGPFIVSTVEHSGSVLAGAERNLSVVAEIAKELKVPIQLSGGVRDLESFKQVIGMGVSRACIGSAAMRDPMMVRQAVGINADALVIYLDTRDGRVVGQEWVPDPKISISGLASHIKEAGVKHFIYQDIAADAANAGPRCAPAGAVGSLGVSILVTGGVHTLDHIREVAATAGVSGVLVGKPLGLGAFTFAQAQEAAKAGLAQRK